MGEGKHPRKNKETIEAIISEKKGVFLSGKKDPNATVRGAKKMRDKKKEELPIKEGGIRKENNKKRAIWTRGKLERGK